MTKKTQPIRKSRRVLDFIGSYRRDLRAVGIRIRVQVKGQTLQVKVLPRRSNDPGINHVLYRNSLSASLTETLDQERRHSAALRFADVSSIIASRIQPRIEICSTPDQRDLYEYLLRFQSIPVNPSVGATIRAIVYDRGQSGGDLLMGVLAINSPRYFQGARDAFLGWPNPKNDQRGRVLRRMGLKRCLHMSVCMAIPPYNQLRCGRMIALLAFSREMQDAYQHRYGHQYVALTATAALRNYAVIYSRIPRNAVLTEKVAGHVFQKIPNVRKRYRYAFNALTEHTWQKAIALSAYCSANRSLTPGESRERILRRALSRCGLSIDLLRTNETATYLGTLDPSNLEVLRRGRARFDVTALDTDCVVNYWRKTHLVAASDRLIRGDVSNGQLVSRLFESLRGHDQ